MDYFIPKHPGREKLIQKSPPFERHSPDDADPEVLHDLISADSEIVRRKK